MSSYARFVGPTIVTVLAASTLSGFVSSPRPFARPQTGLEQAGQSIFSALEEVVARLEADPTTDWSEVSIDSLREHLVQMDDVFVHARVTHEATPAGARFLIDGSPQVLASATAMLQVHTRMSADFRGWQAVLETDPELVLTLSSDDPDERLRIRALGLFDYLAAGGHHRRHHLMMATGAHPHSP